MVRKPQFWTLFFQLKIFFLLKNFLKKLRMKSWNSRECLYISGECEIKNIIGFHFFGYVLVDSSCKLQLTVFKLIYIIYFNFLKRENGIGDPVTMTTPIWLANKIEDQNLHIICLHNQSFFFASLFFYFFFGQVFSSFRFHFF